jgi:membrane fusion protein (multidrug efflux system)
MKKVIVTIIGIVAALGLIAWVLTNNKKKNEEKTAVVARGTGDAAVKTAEVKTTAIKLDFSTNGNFAAATDLKFLAENSGRITSILVKEGSKVSKGQVIAKIDAEILNVDLETAEANYQNALKDQERFQSSFTTGGVTQQQLDQVKLNLSNAQARLQQAKRKLSDATVKSPINGIINQKFVELGAYVSPGTQLFEIVDVSKLKLAVSVNEAQVALLKTGDVVNITTTVYPDKTFKGKVSFIAAKADNSLSFPVEIEVENNAEGQLRAGMYGTATFEFPAQAPGITVPRTAFVGSVSSNEVYVLEGNVARLRKVTAGRNLGEEVEIVNGLQVGETVITSGQINLVDGAKVVVQK